MSPEGHLHETTPGAGSLCRYATPSSCGAYRGLKPPSTVRRRYATNANEEDMILTNRRGAEVAGDSVQVVPRGSKEKRMGNLRHRR